jgi:hypothetical protein
MATLPFPAERQLASHPPECIRDIVFKFIGDLRHGHGKTSWGSAHLPCQPNNAEAGYPFPKSGSSGGAANGNNLDESEACFGRHGHPTGKPNSNATPA